MRAWMGVLRAAAWRLRWLYAVALVATVLQIALGWASIGRALAAGSAAVWRGVSPLVVALWALLVAVAASLFLAAWPAINAVGSRLVGAVGAYRGLRATLIGVGILAALVVVVVFLPPLFVPSLGNPTRQTTAENAVRTTLLQDLGGAVLLLGAWFTWRQLQTAREGQLTERFKQGLDPRAPTRIGRADAVGTVSGHHPVWIRVTAARGARHATWPAVVLPAAAKVLGVLVDRVPVRPLGPGR
jgi:hypothetical protein